MWTCQKCNETHEDSFEACWKCGTSKDGVEDPSFPRVDSNQASEQSSAPVCLCPACNEPMVVGYVSLWGKEDAQLDWTSGPEDADSDPETVIRLLDAGTLLNTEPKRRAHRCMTCGVVTIECEVVKCGYCGRVFPATNKTCICGWSRGDGEWADS